MINIGKDVAAALGHRGSVDEVATIARDLHARLEMLVGVRIADGLTQRQLDAFQSLVDAGDEEGARAWLGREVPNHRDIVAREWARLFVRFADERRRKSA